MKKALALFTAIFCSLYAINFAWATEERIIIARYNVTSSYTVTIPADITFAQGQNTVSSTVSATDVHLGNSVDLKISMTSANGRLANTENAYIPYSITIDDTTEAIERSKVYNLLSVAAGNVAGLTKNIIFTINDLSHAILSGYYTDALTFSVVTDSTLVSNDEFIYGTHYNSGFLQTSYPFGTLKTHNSFITPQKIKIIVDDPINGVSSLPYKANISAYSSPNDVDMISKGSTTTIHDLVNGETTYDLSALYPAASYFRVDVMIYDKNGHFTEIPATTTINVYADDETAPVAQRYVDKKIDILGDSITEQATYIPYLQNLTEASTIVNHGISGQKVTQFASRVTSLDADSDLIIVFGGTNDYWHHETPIGTISDTDSSTFYGALNSIYNSLSSNYPSAEYLFVFPPHQTYSGKDDTYDFGYGTLEDFRIAMRSFASSKDVNFLDLNTIANWNPAVDTSDGVHPNADGGLKIATAINNSIKDNH